MKTNKHSLFFTLALSLVLLTSCVSSKKYHSSDIIEITSFHHQIAILPIEGLSNKLASEYQKDVYNALLSQNRKTVKISVQKISKTNQILHKKKIFTQEALAMDPRHLAELLGVDAVLKVKVEPEVRFNQNLPEVAFNQSDHADAWNKDSFTDGFFSAVNVSAAIFDTQTGEMFWKYDFVKKLKSAELSGVDFEDTSLKIAKHFPYKWE